MRISVRSGGGEGRPRARAASHAASASAPRARLGGASPAAPAPACSMEGLIASLRRNQQLTHELDKSAARLGRAFEYLATPGCNRALADAYLKRGLARYATVLAALRANQAETRRHLGRSQGSRISHPQGR